MKTKVIIVLTVLAVCSSVFAQDSVQTLDRRNALIEKAVHTAVASWMKEENIRRDSTDPMNPDYVRIATYTDSIREVIESSFRDEQDPDVPMGVTFKSAISGRVFENDGVTPITHVPVRIYNTSWQQQGWIETDEQGRYLVGNLNAGNYFVQAEGWISSIGDVYYGEYYDNAGSKSLANQIAVADSDTTVGIDFTLARKAAISGRVTEDGEGPIANTMVNVYNINWECVGGAQTDANGYYTVHGLILSQFYVFATGYIVGEGEFFLEEYYDDAPTKGGASVVAVSPPNTVEGIDFSLTRGFHIWTWTSPSVGWVNVDPQKLVYAPGDQVELYAEVSDLYPQFQFDHWGGGVSGTENPKTITMDADKEVDAYFVETSGPAYSLNLSVNPQEAGEIGRDPEHTVYDSGSTVSLHAEAFEGWTFKQWTGDHEGIENPTVVLMDFDKYITAEFEPDSVVMTMTVIPEGAGSTNPETGDYTYPSGAVVEISATPAEGYHFYKWIGGGVEDPFSASTTVTMNESREVKAKFQLISIVLTMAVTPGDVGTTEPELGSHNCEAGEIVQIRANPAEGYRFVKWYGGGIENRYLAQTTVTMDESRTVTAKFKRKTAILKMRVDPEAKGETDPGVGDHEYEIDSVIEIYAVPIEGYHFVQWEGGGITDPHDPSTTVTMNESRTVTAKFGTELDSLILTVKVSPEDAGHTEPEVGTHQYLPNEIVEIAASPADGYTFDKWTGGGIAHQDSANTTILMNESRTIIAHFKKPDSDPPELLYCYPKPFSRFVPRNAGLQFTLKDRGSGLDIESIHVWVGGILICEEGTFHAGEQLCLNTMNKVHFKYQPSEPFEAESEITVRIRAHDLAEPFNSCDTSYSFTTAAIELAQCDTATVDSTGGNVHHDSTGIHMDIPPNALTSPVIITVSHPDTTPPLPPGFQGVQESFHFGPDGLEFEEPITVKIPYTPELLAASGVEDPHNLVILYFHTSTGEWSQLTIIDVDEDSLCLYVTVEEFCYLTFGKEEVTGIDPPADEIRPESCTLFPNYPNPFNPETRVAFQITETCHVNVSVYDATGRLIRTLINDTKQPGQHETIWDGRNTDGLSVSSGLYLLKMEAGSHRAFRKMSLLK